MDQQIFIKILKDLETHIVALNKERALESLRMVPLVEIVLLGQMSLLINPEINTSLNLVATRDVDALLKAEWSIKKRFLEILKHYGFEYDELSSEIWLPKETTFSTFYDSDYLVCKRIDPLYALVSKAVKAPEKNRILIRAALAKYGEELALLIRKYEGDLEYFVK